MTFPSDIKGCMKDCILSLIWPRRDIYSFFSNHGCTKGELRGIENFRESQLSRSAMIDAVFEHLSSRTDGGVGQFRAMLQSLLKWSYFDPYYFDNLKKLDRKKAQTNLNHLRQLQEIRDAKANQERERRARAKVEQQSPDASLLELREAFLNLYSGKISPQERGYAFEKLLLRLARLSHLDVTEPFRVHGEQIDGAVKFEGENYLIEAKWQDKYASNEPAYQFAHKVEGKMYGRGIFVSVNGFSDEVVRGLVVGKAIMTIFVDGEDLVLVLEGNLAFCEMIDQKVKAAQTRGLIYVHPISGEPKVHGS